MTPDNRIFLGVLFLLIIIANAIKFGFSKDDAKMPLTAIFSFIIASLGIAYITFAP